MAHEQFQEMLAVQGLSALDPADEQALKEHLRTCADCRAQSDQWRTTASALAFMSRPTEPSTKVRERILAQVRAEKESGSISTETNASANVVQFVDRRAQVRPRFGAFEAIAATVIAALLISLFVLWRQNRSTQAELARLSAENRAMLEQLKHKQEIVAFMSAPGAKMAELAGTNMAPGARAKIVYDRSGSAMLIARGLPAAPSGKAYQLWFIVGNNKMPGKTFGTDSSGDGDLNDKIPSSAMQGAVFAITVEPAGGSRSPTGDVFLVSGS